MEVRDNRPNLGISGPILGISRGSRRAWSPFWDHFWALWACPELFEAHFWILMGLFRRVRSQFFLPWSCPGGSILWVFGALQQDMGPIFGLSKRVPGPFLILLKGVQSLFWAYSWESEVISGGNSGGREAYFGPMKVGSKGIWPYQRESRAHFGTI